MRYRSFFLLIVLLVGCSAPAKKVNIENERRFSTEYDKVWETVISWFEKHNILITNMEKISGLIIAESEACPADWADCGKRGVDMGVWIGDPVGAFNVFVQEEPDTKIKVKINSIFFRTYDYPIGEATFDKTCYSNGTFEALLFDEITKSTEQK